MSLLKILYSNNLSHSWGGPFWPYWGLFSFQGGSWNWNIEIVIGWSQGFQRYKDIVLVKKTFIRKPKIFFIYLHNISTIMTLLSNYTVTLVIAILHPISWLNMSRIITLRCKYIFTIVAVILYSTRYWLIRVIRLSILHYR